MAEEHGTKNCWHHDNGFVHCTAGQAQRIIKNLHACIEYGVVNDVGDYQEPTR